MTDLEIKKASLMKAIKNGFKKEHLSDRWKNRHELFEEISFADWVERYVKSTSEYPFFEVVLFDKEFWKCLVGMEWVIIDNECKGLAWQYHMQQIALEDKRINYLKQFLDD